MVGHAALREVVGTVTVAAIAAAQQVTTRRCFRLLAFRHFGRVDTRTQHGQGFGFVFMLRTLVLTLHHNTGWQVSNTDSGIGGVNVLAARTRGAESVDAQVRRVDVRQFRFRQLWHHRHCTGRGMNTPLRFRSRHALHAMTARFKLQTTIHAVAADLGDNLFIATMLAVVSAHDFHAPATRFSVAAVHAEQIPGKQRRFVTAGTGADFHKRVTLVVRIFWQQQHLKLLLHLFRTRFRIL